MTKGYEAKLEKELQATDATELAHFEIEDKAMEERLVEFAESRNLVRTELQSPMFLCSRDEFAAFAKDSKRLLMGEFYKQQRRRLDLLVDDAGQPTGDQWSFDADNRKKLPKSLEPPTIDWANSTKHVDDVIELVSKGIRRSSGQCQRSFAGRQRGSRRSVARPVYRTSTRAVRSV